MPWTTSTLDLRQEATARVPDGSSVSGPLTPRTLGAPTATRPSIFGPAKLASSPEFPSNRTVSDPRPVVHSAAPKALSPQPGGAALRPWFALLRIGAAMANSRPQGALGALRRIGPNGLDRCIGPNSATLGHLDRRRVPTHPVLRFAVSVPFSARHARLL